MEDLIARFSGDMVGRIDGPMTFRLLLQPLMAIAFAIRDGRRDAHEGRAPYFWSFFTEPAHRHELLLDGWRGVSRIFLLAVLLDVIYSYVVFRQLFIPQTLVVASLLALVPYVLLRGPTNRLITRLMSRKVAAHEQHNG
jgi:hypothetical protein